MRCAIYCRVSTDDQAGAGHVSLEVQEARCRSYVASRNGHVVTVETDQESGLKESRAGYQRILTLARSGGIDAVVVYQASRFGREAAEVLTRAKELRSLNVDLLSTAEDLTSFLMLGIQAVLNEEESRRIVERTMPAKRHKTEQGYWLAHAPMGTVNDHGVLKPGPRFDLVRTAFELCAGGESIAEITRRLNAAIAPELVKYATVIKTLRNIAYIGVVRWGGIEASAQWAPLIDPTVFEKANAEIRKRYVERRALTRSYPYWILGLAFCARCGWRMHPKVHVSSWGTYPYVLCGRRANMGMGRVCQGVYTKILQLQEDVLSQVRLQVNVERIASHLEELEAAQNAGAGERRASLIAERERLQARVQKAKAGYLDDVLTAADVRRVEESVRDAAAAIDRELTVPRRAAEFSSADVRTLFQDDAWFELRHEKPAEFRELLRMFVERVDVDGEESRITWRASVAAAIVHA